MTSGGVARRRFRVTGRVQGVGFRYFTLCAGRRLGLVGWVRNERDGSVTAEAEGLPEDLERFVEHLRQGPSYSRVSGVAVEDLVPLGDERRFEVR